MTVTKDGIWVPLSYPLLGCRGGAKEGRRGSVVHGAFGFAVLCFLSHHSGVALDTGK